MGSTLYLSRMNAPSRAVSSRIMPSIVLIAVIASLCFSIGEGLRLTPFPVSASTAKPVEQLSKHKYGPLDVPTQHSKRTKRQAEPLDFLIAPVTREVAPALTFSTVIEQHEVASVLVVSQFAGRAPPFVS